MTTPPTDLPIWMRQRQRWIDWGLLFVIIIGLLLNWPLAFWPGLPSNTDAALFVTRSMEIADSLRSGTLYTRWAADFYFGYGSPLFNYLAPLPHYLSGLHQLITDANPIDSVKLWLAISVITAGVGMYHFARRRYGLRAGLIAAVVYMTSTPIAYALPIQSGNLSALLSLAILPWVLWAFDRLIAKPGRGEWLSAISTFVTWSLVDTRLTAIGLPLLVIVLTPAWLKRQTRLAIWGAVCTTALLTAFFWLPALVERSDVQWVPLVDDPMSGAIPLTESLGSIPMISAGVLNPPTDRGLGIGFTLIVLTGSVAVINTISRHGNSTMKQAVVSWDVIAFSVIGVGAVLLTTPLLAEQWMQSVGWQPIRPYDLLLGAALPALTVLAAQSSRWLDGYTIPDNTNHAARININSMPWRVMGLIFVLIPTLATLAPTLTSPVWLAARSLDAPLSRHTETTINAIGTLRTGLLLPLAAYETGRPLSQIVFNDPEHDPNRTEANLLLINRGTLTSRFTLSSLKTSQTFTLDRFAFPDWSVELNNITATNTVSRDGLVRVDIASPLDTSHGIEVLLVFGDTPIRYAAWLLTGLGFIVLLVHMLLKPKMLMPHNVLPIVDNWQRHDAIALIMVASVFCGLAIVLRLPPNLSTIINVPDTESSTGIPTSSYPATVVTTTYDSVPYMPGSQLTLILYWRVFQPINADWQLVARLVPDTGTSVALSLANSLAVTTQWQPGSIPTSHWPVGMLIRDPFTMTIPMNIAIGNYRVQVALTQCDNPQRLPCTQPTPILSMTNQPGAEWLTLPGLVQIVPHH